MGVRRESRPAHPGMIDREERVDRLGELTATQRERAELASVVHALQSYDAIHGSRPQAPSFWLMAG
ncbi:hypothetical protein D3C78_1941730 [compost metagenome]